MKRFTIILMTLIIPILASHLGCVGKIRKEVQAVPEMTPKPWENQPPSLWENLLPASKTDAEIPVPTKNLTEENIGTMGRVENLYDRWTINDAIKDRTFTNYTDVTTECKGKVEIDFALTPQEWAKTENQIKYYEAVDKLIDSISGKLLSDFGNVLQGDERDFFVLALKTAVWRESLWQHYFRYKNWFFILLSESSFNKLGDWGITQIARSHYKTGELLSKNFFDSKGYCKISSSLYYGALIYYFNYLDARQKSCNGDSIMTKFLGAYNRYSSGYSACFWDISQTDETFRNYQLDALGGFLINFVSKPWESKIAELKNSLPNHP